MAKTDQEPQARHLVCPALAIGLEKNVALLTQHGEQLSLMERETLDNLAAIDAFLHQGEPDLVEWSLPNAPDTQQT